MIRGLYHKIKNANADELRRWRFVFWLSFISSSLLVATILLLIGFGKANSSIIDFSADQIKKTTAPFITTAPLYGVMIDNAGEARPQSGLNQAVVVIEAPVEGGYTRLLAVFDSSASVSAIGPVRSIRPYFIDWSKSLGTALVHIGGSPAAMEQMQQFPYPNVDGIKSGCCMYRSQNRFSPHNAYTSSELLKKYVVSEAVLPNILYRQDGEQFKGDVVLGVEIEFAKNIQKPSFRYNQILDGYVRSQGKEVLKDALDNKPVMTENIVIMKTEIEVIDSQSRRSVETTGTGEALFLMNGKVAKGTWELTDNGPLVFKDNDGENVVWNPGRIWIEVVDTDSVVTLW